VSRYEFIDSQKSEPVNRNPVSKMCRWLDVSTSGFYHWLTRPQSVTSARRQALLVRVRHYFEESDGTYGYRRIHADLAAEQTLTALTEIPQFCSPKFPTPGRFRT